MSAGGSRTTNKTATSLFELVINVIHINSVCAPLVPEMSGCKCSIHRTRTYLVMNLLRLMCEQFDTSLWSFTAK